MIRRHRRVARSAGHRGDFHAQRAQPVLDPLTLHAAPEGRLRHVLDVSHARLLLGLGLFAVIFAVIAARLALVTLLPGDGEASLARVTAGAPAGRADILDRNGVVLATSLTTASLYANPRQIHDAAATARQLNTLFPDLAVAAIEAKLGADKSFVWLKRSLTPRQQQAVNDLGIPGLYFEYETKRVYPQGNLAAHVVGFTDVDARGLAGIERSFDDVLAGGQKPLLLSLDVRIQHILHEELSKAIADFSGIGGAGIVLDIATGEVLALVSLPDFDPASPGTASADTRFNRATLGAFEMGSTFKIFNTAIGLDSGTVTLGSGYDATHPIRIGRFTIDDFKGKHRFLSVPEIFTYSSNIGSAKMADAFGAETQQRYLGRFGLLDKSPLELPEVGAPHYPEAKSWKRVNTMTVAYGHGISVTPIQLASGVAAAVDGGRLRPPTLLKRAPGEVPEGARAIAEQTSAQIRQLMRLVVQVGTGKNADAPGYLVGGKTGTADKQQGRGYNENSRLASFIAAFPMSKPRYVVLAMVDEPKPNQRSHGYATGGWVAAPAVGALIQRMAPLMGLMPIPETAPEAQNPLVAMVADYDSAASKKPQSPIIPVALGEAAATPEPSPKLELNEAAFAVE